GFDVKLIEINRTCEVTKHIKYAMMVVYSNYHDVIGFAKAKGEAIPSASQKSSALTTFGAANSSPGPGNMDRNSLIPAMVAMISECISRDFVAEQISLKGIKFHTKESPQTLIKSADGSFSLKLIKEQPRDTHMLCFPQDASRIQGYLNLHVVSISEGDLLKLYSCEGDLLKLTLASFIEINSIVIESDQCCNKDWLLILAFSLGSDYVYLDVPDPDSLIEFAKNVIKYAETRLNPTLVIEAELAQKVGNDIKMPQLQ
nr:ribosomal protein S5 [Tanacetum cinerariifolium]